MPEQGQRGWIQVYEISSGVGLRGFKSRPPHGDIMIYEKLFHLVLSFRKDLDEEKLNKMVEKKINELGGLVSRDAALLLIAKELKVDIPYDIFDVYNFSSMKIKDLVEGLKNVSLSGIVYRITPPRIYSTNRGKRRVQKIYFFDESANIRLTLWDSQIDDANKAGLRLGTLMKIQGARVSKYKDKLELSLNKSGKLIFQPHDTDDYKKHIPEKYRGQDLKVLVTNIVTNTLYKNLSVLTGFSDNKIYVRILFWGDSANYLKNISVGDNIFLQNIVIKNLKKEIIEGLFTPYSFLYKLSKGSISEDIDVKNIFPFDQKIEGEIVFMIPYSKHRLLLTLYSDHKFKEVIIWGKMFIDEILKNVECDKVILNYLDLVDNKYKVNLWSNIFYKKVLERKKYEKYLIFETKNLSEIIGTIVEFSLDLYIYSKTSGFKKISHIDEKEDLSNIRFLTILKGTIDDGTGRLKIFSNSPYLFENLLYVKIASIRKKFYSITLVKNIIDFMRQDMIGKEVIAKGKTWNIDGKKFMRCNELVNYEYNVQTEKWLEKKILEKNKG